MNIDRDPGLQPQRTALGWSRTVMATAVNSLLILRIAVLSQSPFIGTLTTMLLLGTTLLCVTAHRRKSALIRMGGRRAVPGHILSATCVTIAIAVCGALLLR